MLPQGRGKGTNPGKGSKKGLSRIDEDEESSEECEKRIEPVSGFALTFKELCGLHRGKKTLTEVKEFWETECRLLYRGGLSAGQSRTGHSERCDVDRSARGKGAPQFEACPAVSRSWRSADSGADRPPTRSLWNDNRVAERSHSRYARHGDDSRAGSFPLEGESSSVGMEVEKRMDMEDGTLWTFQELTEWYHGWYSREQIKEYWNVWCQRVRTPTRDVGYEKGRVSEADPDLSGRRIDPSDGCAYTFEEMVDFYRDRLSRTGLKAYWQNACVPEQSSKGKSKGSSMAGGKNSQDGESVMTPSDSCPRLYVMRFTTTEDLAKNMCRNRFGWYIDVDGDPHHRRSILIPGGQKVYAPSYSDMSTPSLPTALCATAKDLEDLLKGIPLVGGEGEFPGFVFLFSPGASKLISALLDALGIHEDARKEATLEIMTWEDDFTEQQQGRVTHELRQATELLKAFGVTYELSFSDQVTCAPVLYLSRSRTRPNPVLGVIHSRLHNQRRRYTHRPYSKRQF